MASISQLTDFVEVKAVAELHHCKTVSIK